MLIPFCTGLSKSYMTHTLSQPAITCSKLAIETLEQGVKYVQLTIKTPE